MKLIQAIAMAVSGLLAGSLQAQEPDPEKLQERIEELETRLDEVEELQFETMERTGSRALVQSYSAESLDLGGHLTSVWTAMSGEESSEVGHLVTFFETFFRAKVSERFSLFATPGFFLVNFSEHSDPDDPTLFRELDESNNLILARAYGEYNHSNLLQIQAGIVGTPHGVTNREYFIPARQITATPLHTRVFLVNHLYPQRIMGAKASGKLLVGETRSNHISYDAYAGTESNNPNEAALGARVGYTLADLDLTLAANYGHGRREAHSDLEPYPLPIPPTFPPTPNLRILQSPFPVNSSVRTAYDFVGFDLDWRSERFNVRTEFYYSSEEVGEDRKALSQEQTWFVRPDVGLTYRFDYFDAGQGLGHATEHAVGVSYDPAPNVRIRLDGHHQELPNDPGDLQFLNLSFTLSF